MERVDLWRAFPAALDRAGATPEARTRVGHTAAPTRPSDPTDRLSLVLEQLEALPTLSPVAARLLALGTGDDVELDEIVALIEADPTLTTRILGLCRRAGVGMSEQITTVRHAAVMLGLEAVRSAVLSVSVYELLEGEGERADERAFEVAGRLDSHTLSLAEFDREGFWRYSIGVATAAEMLTARHKGLNFRAEEAFVAGLLADMGKLLLDYALPKGFARIIEAAGRRGVPLAHACRELIGIDHHQAGARVGTRWGLPGVLVGVMGGHGPDQGQHLPEGVSRELLGIVRTAVDLCRELHIGFSAELTVGNDPERTALQHGLSVHAVEEVRELLHAAVSQRCALMGLDEQAGHAMLMRSIAAANRHLTTLNETLQQRAAKAKCLGETLGTIEWFLEASRGADARPLSAAIAISASRVLGGERWMVLRPAGEQWIGECFDAQGRLIATHQPGSATLDDALHSLETGWLLHTRLHDSTGESIGAVCGRTAVESPVARHHAALLKAWSTALMVHLAPTIHAQAQPQATPASFSDESNNDSALLDGVVNAIDAAVDALGEHAGALQGHVKDKSSLLAVRGVLEATEALRSVLSGLRSVRTTSTTAAGVHALRAIADESIRQARRRTGWKGEVDAEGIDPGDHATVDRSMIEQALTELIVNAMEASTDSDVLIAAHRAGSGDRWEVRVTDRGCGPEPGAADRVFEAFYTAKPPERHAGMGLTRARAMMRAHGGDAKLERTEDGRTRAMLLFTELTDPAGERGAAA